MCPFCVPNSPLGITCCSSYCHPLLSLRVAISGYQGWIMCLPIIMQCFNPYPKWNEKKECWGCELVPQHVMETIENVLQWPIPCPVANIPGYARHYSLAANKYNKS